MQHIHLQSIHSSWTPFFTAEIISLLEAIDGALTPPCTPSAPHVLRFAQQSLADVQVLILGQDTYPALGAATGRSFEVGGLTSWHTPFKQISLKHIVQNIYGVYTGASPYTPMSQVRCAIQAGAFPIAPPDALFQSWADQGVLLLNTALTCQVGQPASHTDLWEPFSQALLAFIAQAKPDIHVFLWGRYAQSFQPVFPTQQLHSSRHPMMCSEKYADDFLKFTGFSATQSTINWLGDPPVTTGYIQTQLLGV